MEEEAIYKGKKLDEILDTIAEEKGIARKDITYEVIETKKGLIPMFDKILVKYIEPDSIESTENEDNKMDVSDDVQEKSTPEEEKNQYKTNLNRIKTDDQAGEVEKIFNDIKELMDIDIQAEFKELDRKISVYCQGKDLDIFFGKGKRNIKSIQYIIGKIFSRKVEQTKKIVFERLHNETELMDKEMEDMAIRLAEKSKNIKKSITINALTARERKIIHMKLKDMEGINTNSQGDGLYRSLMLIPEEQ